MLQSFLEWGIYMSKKMKIDYKEYPYSEDDEIDLTIVVDLYNYNNSQKRLSKLSQLQQVTCAGVTAGYSIGCIINMLMGNTPEPTTFNTILSVLQPIIAVSSTMSIKMSETKLEIFSNKMKDLEHVKDSIISKYSGEEVSNPMTLDNYIDKYRCM